MMSNVGKNIDFIVLGFNSYADYIDSFANVLDRRYMSSRRVIKTIVQLGYRSTKIPYDELEFRKRRDIALQSIRPKISGLTCFGDFMSPSNKDPVLLEFKRRELPNLNKFLSTIVFTSYINTDGSEISGYLDLDMCWRNAMQETLKHTDWKGVFEGRTRLKPMSHHLSYSNPRYNMLKYNNSDNFLVVHDHQYGLMFMHRGDHKRITVGGQYNQFSKNARRTMVYSPKYGYVVFYDHIVRKKV